MKHNYFHALALTLKHEGHFVNNPHDKGGPTNEGITLATYRADIDPGGTVEGLRNISHEQVAAEYRKEYWDKVRGDDLPDGVDFVMFDYSVLSSPLRAVRALQSVVGVVADGKLTNATLAAVLAVDPKTLVHALCDYRLNYLKRLSDWKYFGRGWQNRVEEVRAEALSMEDADRQFKPQPENPTPSADKKPETQSPPLPVSASSSLHKELHAAFATRPAKSKTVWTWALSGLGTAITGIGHLFGGLDWRVQLFISGAIISFAIYGIKRRVDLFKAVKDLQSELD